MKQYIVRNSRTNTLICFSEEKNVFVHLKLSEIRIDTKYLLTNNEIKTLFNNQLYLLSEDFKIFSADIPELKEEDKHQFISENKQIIFP